MMETGRVETAGKLLHDHDEGLPGVASTRVALVTLIIVFQSIQVSESYLRLVSTPIWILAATLYPALFSISGFLMARSADNRQSGDFLVRRARRLLPALVVIVLLAALVLGPMATTKPLRAYVSDPDFGLYFLNILAWPRFTLPAVFQFNNVGTVVNLPLWLSPFVLSAIAIAALTPRFGTRLLVLTVLLVLSLVVGLAIYIPDLAGFSNLQRRLLDGSGAGVLLAFLFGALAYRLRHRLPVHPPIAYLCVAVMIGVSLFGNRTWLSVSAANVLLAMPAAYLALFMAFQFLPFSSQSLRMERYLLGFLLFSFPIQQLWIAFGPRQQSFLTNLFLAVPTISLLVLVIWHGLQKRIFLPAADDPRFGDAAQQPLVPLSRRQITERLPSVVAYTTLGLVLFAVALGVMALTFLAFQPESGGV
jgi:peptidoglycan/LPS O-acetylase OafA/YrhL